MRNFLIPTKDNNYAPKLLHHKKLHLYGLAGVAFKILLTLVLFNIYPSQAYFSSITKEKIVQLVNQERVNAGITPLSSDNILDQAAGLKAEDMVERNYFSHFTADGTTPWDFFKKVNYQYTYAGENLGMGFSDAESLVKAWMASPKHKKNILNPAYHDIGIAIQAGKINNEQTTLAVQMFGTSFIADNDSNGPSITIPETSPSNALVSGAEQVVQLQKGPTTWWNTIANTLNSTYNVIIIFLIILLLLKIFINIKIQHTGIIAHSVFVIILFTILALMNLHFIENVLKEPLISLL